MLNLKTIATASAMMLSLAACDEMSTKASPKSVTITNETGITVYRFYGSNTGSRYWEDDKLGSEILPSGSSFVVDFEDGSGLCTFDFRVEFIDDTYYEDYGVNVCEIAEYRIQLDRS